MFHKIFSDGEKYPSDLWSSSFKYYDNIFKVVFEVETFYLIGFAKEKIINLKRKYLLGKLQGLKKRGIIGFLIPITFEYF